MTSLTAVQTKGIKRSLADVQSFPGVPGVSGANGDLKDLGGKKKQKWKVESDCEEDVQPETNGNVIGLDVVEESSSDDEDEPAEEPPQEDSGQTEEPQPEVPEPIKNLEKIVAPPVGVAKTPVPRESKPAVFVPVNRSAEVQASRMKLPILAEEQAIVEAIHDHPVVVLAGETGSGKTTQVYPY